LIQYFCYILDYFDRNTSEAKQKEIIRALIEITRAIQQAERDWNVLKSAINNNTSTEQANFQRALTQAILDKSIEITKIKVKIQSLIQLEGIMPKDELQKDQKNMEAELLTLEKELEKLKGTTWKENTENNQEYSKNIESIVKYLDDLIANNKDIYEKSKSDLEE